ncbi:MAG: TlpA family protein disulfide reductase [Candidatus Mariimomonas ferrooxydans]
MKFFFRATIFILTLTIFVLFINELDAELFSPWVIERLVGKEAPEFTAKDLSGNSVTLSAFKGRPILLNFWATWCPDCREERPYLNFLYSEYKDRGLVIIAVSTDKSVQKVKAYLERTPMNFTILHDSSNKAAESYGVYSLPASFLIDRRGIIKHKFIELRDWTDKKTRKPIEGLFE